MRPPRPYPYQVQRSLYGGVSPRDHRSPVQRRIAETTPDAWGGRQLQSGMHDQVTLRAEAFSSPHIPRVSLGSMTLISLAALLGLACTELAYQRAFNGGRESISLIFLFIGLLAIFIPIAVRVTMRRCGRAERLTLTILLGVILYLVKIQRSPRAFTFIDEYIHLRNTEDILNTHHIFHYNPLLPTAAYYPGLAAVTASLVNLTGLSTFVSGLIVVGIARVIVSACIFLIVERVSRSARAAGVASLIYAANPAFLFWSSSFSYEDLALPLAFFVVWWLGRTRVTVSYAAQLITVITIIAITFTHHISAFALAGALGMWYLASLILRKPRPERQYLGIFTIFAGTLSTIWFFMVARPADAYIISQNVAPALKELSSVIVRAHAGRDLYGGGGSAPPLWYVAAGFAAIGLIMLGLLPGLWRAWTLFSSRTSSNALYRRASIAVVAIIAASFPFTLLPRLTVNGGMTSARTSEYVFAAIGCTLGLLAIECRNLRTRHFARLSRIINWVFADSRGTILLFGIILTAFIGGITIGNPYPDLLPPSAQPTGFPPDVQPDVIAASIWARDHLGLHQSYASDSIDSLALATYGDENPVAEDIVYPIFFGDSLGGTTARAIRVERVRYIFVDWRMASGPATNSGGYYFSPWEPNAGSDISFPAAYLRKFATYSCDRMVYHSGPVQIFDVTRIENGTCSPKLASDKKVSS